MRELLVIDHFLDDFEEFQAHAKRVKFEDLKNPTDGVVYPDISIDIPKAVRAQIIRHLRGYLGREPEISVMFMRQSAKGVSVPHQVHSDLSMGNYSLMLYLNTDEECQGGTSFLAHKLSGIAYNPERPVFSDIVVNDQNNADAWRVCDMVEMRPNRGVIFDASRLHRAEPVGGFGLPNDGARVVLTCFFS